MFREAMHLQGFESLCALFRNSVKIAVEAAFMALLCDLALKYVVVSGQLFSA
jgi:ABC-type Fe3+ transport system permease subunit